MFNDINIERVYLARGSTDLRKSIGGLAVLVKEGFDLDPFSPCLFIFCNRKHDKLKILQWDHIGFWLLSGIRDKSHYPDIFVIPKFPLQANKTYPFIHDFQDNFFSVFHIKTKP